MLAMGEDGEQFEEISEEADVEQKAKDKIARDLEDIRRRKTKTSKRRFLSNKEDYILFAGIGYIENDEFSFSVISEGSVFKALSQTPLPYVAALIVPSS